VATAKPIWTQLLCLKAVSPYQERGAANLTPRVMTRGVKGHRVELAMDLNMMAINSLATYPMISLVKDTGGLLMRLKDVSNAGVVKHMDPREV